MRRRLGRFLPIVMLAMLVQIFAPVAACLAFSPATIDPLVGAICSHASDTSLSQDREDDPQQMHGACCTLCCLVHHAAAPPPDPQAFEVRIERDATRVTWRDLIFDLRPLAAHSNAQARAPPFIS
ncbi:DUF2946 domain-containing protein [Nitrobacter sp.]|uniref:DUF2946 domain-containing protein n=1 Tax=unclassified Nitrobacter TaxID=2620411 RepID=UPI00321FB8B7